MHLDDRLDDWKAAPLPWEVEMEVDDPEPEVATVDVDVPFTSLHFTSLPWPMAARGLCLK